MGTRLFLRLRIVRLALALFVLGAVGCNGAFENSGVRAAKRFIDDCNKLTDVLIKVTDAPTAKAAIPEVKQLYAALSKDHQALLDYESSHGGETRGLKATIEEIERGLKESEQKLVFQIERIGAIEGLPKAFWCPVRFHSYQILARTLEYQGEQQQAMRTSEKNIITATREIAELYKDLGAEKIVELEISNVPARLREKVLAKISESISGDVDVIEMPTPGPLICVVGPTSFEEVVEKLDFGEITARNDARCELAFRLDERKIEKERWVPRPGQEPAASWDEKMRNDWLEAISQYGNDQVVIFRIVNAEEIRGQNLNPLRAVKDLTSSIDGKRQQRFSKDAGWVAPVLNFDQAVSQVRNAKVVGSYPDKGLIEVRIEPSERLSDVMSFGGARPRFSAAPANGARASAPRSRLPNRSAPDYYQKLAELMIDSQGHLDSTEAVRALLEVDPKEIDSQVRKKIARNFREMTLNEPFEKDLAVKGLVLYGGRYSVPILVGMIAEENLSIDEAVFDGLASVPDERGAKALVALLGNHFNHDNAVAALRKMGPVAEMPLHEAANSDDSKVLMALLDLLGDVGTKESFPLLRKAVKSRDPEMKQAAKDAIASIRQREKDGS